MLTLKRLTKLNDLLIGLDADPTPALETLKNASSLYNLGVNKTNLKASDFELISAMSSLRRLQVSDNEMTDKNLTALSKLKELTVLVAENTNLTGDCIPILQQLKSNKLQALDVSSHNFTASDCRAIKKLFPKAVVEISKKEKSAGVVDNAGVEKMRKLIDKTKL